MRKDKGEEEEVGQRHFLLCKCEEEGCGVLFCTTLDIYFNDEAMQTLECPEGHKKIRFIQPLTRTAIIPVK